MTALFIGVVSHAGTRFPDAQTPEGLPGRLAAGLTALGIPCTIRVCLDDAHDPVTLPIDGALVRRSLDAQLRVEHAWESYLRRGLAAGSFERLGAAGLLALRWVKQTLAHVRPWHGPDRVDASGTRLIRRLVNIELAHLSLIRDGVASGADWILILEDDAGAIVIDDTIRGLASLMRQTADQPQPAYVNVSQSFTPQELGIAHLLAPADHAEWEGTVSRSLLSAERPVTNTVCAMLYRTSFARILIPALEAIPLDPVVPIDWKLNLALIHLNQSALLGAGDCWLVDPAPIDQRSMRAAP